MKPNSWFARFKMPLVTGWFAQLKSSSMVGLAAGLRAPSAIGRLWQRGPSPESDPASDPDGKSAGKSPGKSEDKSPGKPEDKPAKGRGRRTKAPTAADKPARSLRIKLPPLPAWPEWLTLSSLRARFPWLRLPSFSAGFAEFRASLTAANVKRVRWLMMTVLTVVTGTVLLAIFSPAEVDCKDWLSQDFWRAANRDDVKTCLTTGSHSPEQGAEQDSEQGPEQGPEQAPEQTKTKRDIAERDTDGETPLHYAAAFGNGETVAALHEAGADLEAVGTPGLTPLYVAASRDNIEAVQALLAAGGKLGAEARDGSTALHIATHLGHARVVTTLLDAGAEARGRMKNRLSAIDLANRNEDFQKTEAYQQLRTAIAQPNAATDCQNWMESEFWTIATANDVKLCLEGGADLAENNKVGGTPLHYAAALGGSETIVALVEAGADLEARAGPELTPLNYAARLGIPRTVDALLEAGADISSRGKAGGTPLHNAAGWGGDAGIIRALVTAGADLEARTLSGWTPLHVAARHGVSATVLALLDIGANPKVRTNDGAWPIDLAEKNENLTGTGAFQLLYTVSPK